MAKSRYVLILARSPQQAALYARRADLERFTYRAVSSAGSITGIQVADVHILPEFHARPDSHAILARLRYGRDIRYIDVEMPDPLEGAPVDQGDGMGEQLSLTDLIEVTQRPPLGRHKSVDPVIELVAVPVSEGFEKALGEGYVETPDLDPELLAVEPKRRRTRCKVCGLLTAASYDEDLEGHNTEAHRPVIQPARSSQDIF